MDSVRGGRYCPFTRDSRPAAAAARAPPAEECGPPSINEWWGRCGVWASSMGFGVCGVISCGRPVYGTGSAVPAPVQVQVQVQVPVQYFAGKTALVTMRRSRAYALAFSGLVVATTYAPASEPSSHGDRENHCSRECHGHTCGVLRHPPRGVAPLHCTSLLYIGCNCTGCCFSGNGDAEHSMAASMRPTHDGNNQGEQGHHSQPQLGSSKAKPNAAATAGSRCKPSDDGSSTRSCSSFCNPGFAVQHCPFCTCSGCDWCASPAALRARLQPPPPPPPQAPPSKLQIINHMWRNGKPSSELSASGVVVRMLDGLTRGAPFPWEPCAKGTWCDKFSSIWPSTLINKLHNTGLYGDGGVGFVLAPPPLNRFFCIYPRDGNSMGHVAQSNGCQNECASGSEFDCSFSPERLQEALDMNSRNRKYNEVVIDAQHMKAHLPRSLLGVFYVAGEGRDAGDDKERATQIHQDFLSKYYQAGATAEFPLMQLTAVGFL